MKKSDFKQLIKEEIKKVLSEGRQTLPLKDLTLDMLKDIAEPIQMNGIDKLNANLPYPSNEYLVLNLKSQFAQRDLDLYKDELVSQFGADILNASVILDSSEEWYNKVKINDQEFQAEKEKRS